MSTTRLTRRHFVKNTAALSALFSTVNVLTAASRKSSDITIERISYSYDEHLFRAPVGFAGAVVSRATMITVRCSVRTAAGQSATGFGCMPFNHTFSFPSKTLPNEAKNDAMKALAVEVSKVIGSYQEFGHPLELNLELAPLYLKGAAEISKRLNLADPIPKLCTLVTTAAFDAAIHDAFGKLHQINCFDTYGPEFMNYDLSRYLGVETKANILAIISSLGTNRA